MRVAIYGGSFNPPHVGHAMVASWVRWTDQADQVWFVPTFAHAFGKELMPWEVRLAMVRATAALIDGADVCTIEAELPTPSYTIDTLRALSARHPDVRFRLLVGADVLQETARWKAWDVIARDHHPIVVGRGGYPPIDGVPTFPDVSSTEVRDRLARGLPVSELVPREVDRLLWQEEVRVRVLPVRILLNVLEDLDILGNPEVHRRSWLHGEGPVSDFSECVGELFEYSTVRLLMEEGLLADAVGDAAAEALSALHARLEPFPTDMRHEDVLSHPDWPTVVEHARRAAELLRARIPSASPPA